MKSKFGLIYKILTKDNLSLAFHIQKSIWTDDPDYQDLYDKATNTSSDNCFFLVYDKEILIGITGVDTYLEYPDTIWLDWFAVLPEHRKKGYGEKMLLDTIAYCKNLKKYVFFRIDTTYYKDRPALFLYDKIMHLKENYTIEDTKNKKNNFLIYTYSFNGIVEPWNNRYLGLRNYYDKCQ